ncbi:putative exported protein [Halobacteriovorax marinus SJ]|uniref:Exported protein n=1 Tax=Halobacteriovorax marinus (strain ATCC BAA-682 / DSM 15412 / SJ) TaxID=862908 RepID=E1X4Y6_HALMS|nr:hypothetical protein [Halobacteriovorax marinus]CBW27212.1 putative exported protein [Halobacteriovorax marinus SJ]
MKKLFLSSMVLLFATQQALAHRETRCTTRRNRYGERVQTCRTVHHTHRGSNYGDGFFDGMLASTLLLITSSDADSDYNRDFLESEITFALATAEGEELVLSTELQELVDETRALNEGTELSDEEILEAYLLEL